MNNLRLLSALLVASTLGALNATAQVRNGPTTANSGTTFAWETVILEEAKTLRQSQPDAVRKLYNLDGLNPEIYRKWRRPEPAVGRELAKKSRLAALMIEIHYRGLENYPYLPSGDRTKQRQALAEGLLHAIGKSGHPHAAAYLIHVLELRGIEPGEYRAALGALGRTRSQRGSEYLRQISRDENRATELRAVALIALGHRHTDAVSAEFSHFLKVDTPTAMLGASLKGISLWASRLVQHTQITSEARQQMGKKVIALVSQLSLQQLEILEAQVASSLGALRETKILEGLSQLKAGSSTTSAQRNILQRIENRVRLAHRRSTAPWLR